MTEEKSKFEATLYETQHELDQLREQMKFFLHNGELNLADIEEALGLLRLKRERGLLEDEENYAVCENR